MVLVFILLGIIVFVLSFAFAILLSTFHINIKDLEASNLKVNITDKEKQNNNGYAVILSLYLFNKIRWLFIHLNDEKLRKMYTKMQLEKIDIKKIEQNFKLEDLKIIKNMNPKISYLKLNAKLGIRSPVITSFMVSTICSIIAIILPYLVIDLKEENYRYYIEPIYQNKNLYEVKLNCVIQIKMVHIINAIYMFSKKKD